MIAQMTLLRKFWLAMISGAVIEASLCVLYVMFGRIGPCGPGNDITGLLMFVHLPAIAFTGALGSETWLDLPIIIIVTAGLWGVLALVIITIVSGLHHRVRRLASSANPNDQ